MVKIFQTLKVFKICLFIKPTFSLLELKNNKGTEYVKIRSTCEWHKFGEKSSKFFLNLEKQHPLQIQELTQTLLYGEKEVSGKKINQELQCFYKNLFTEKSKFQKEYINTYLSQFSSILSFPLLFLHCHVNIFSLCFLSWLPWIAM